MMDTDSVERLLGDYVKHKALADDAKARADEFKAQIVAALERDGVEDDRGHRWIELENPVGPYVAVQHQKRISKALDEQAADEILSSLGLKDRCVKTVEVLDEDAVMAALYDGLLTDEHIDRMFPSKVVWAFVPSKG